MKEKNNNQTMDCLMEQKNSSRSIKRAVNFHINC